MYTLAMCFLTVIFVIAVTATILILLIGKQIKQDEQALDEMAEQEAQRAIEEWRK